MPTSSSIFCPATLGSLKLANRIAMAPMTRCRATGHQPNELMAEYYGQRASAGLIITECAMVTPETSAFGNDPGIYNDAQMAGWHITTDVVHKRGGKIFLQIWHAGRACHPLLNGGKEAVSSSAIAIDDETHTPEGKKPYTVPRALSVEEIGSIVEDFKQAAVRAIEAGFDGVEIHGANGYLIDQFLRDGCNRRTDEYGGSFANRSRFLFEILESVTSAIGGDKVGVRLSPLNSFNSMSDSNPIALTTYLATELNRFKLAYLHLMRADFMGIQTGDVITPARAAFCGHLMVNMGYDLEEANQTVTSGQADSVAFGAVYISNPDLPERFKNGLPLTPPNPDTFYTSDATGFTDYSLASASV